MLRHARAALAAAVVVATFALAPAMAGQRATLKVTARVENRCTVEVPPRVPPWVWRDWRHRPRHFVHHRCHGKAPFRVHAQNVLFERVRDRFWSPSRHDNRRVRESRHPSRHDVVLITITY
jgi:hypothetical protein